MQKVISFREVNVVSTGTSELTVETNVVLYPNPTTGKLHIAAPAAVQHIRVYALTGALVREVAASSADLSGLAKGMYLIKVELVDGRAGFGKVVVK